MPDTLEPQAPDRGTTLALLRERLVAFAASRFGRDGAEDLAQEVLVVLETKYREVGAMEDLVPLAFQILRFKAVAWRRRSLRRGEHLAVDPEAEGLAGDAPNPHLAAERQELLGRLLKALEGLGPRCRELFRLKLDGLSFPEIQTRLGAEVLNTVYTWDHRCRKQLLAALGGRWQP
ncbi:MAG TPA: sigma-70 family RNA polymerase sigma factor [Holophaga sp.]|nr:sigma-70 family RNA polymerase sigma factor [Holophaga sp.]